VTTIWGFLSQVLSDDHSCRDTVARIIAHRAASGLPVCSPNTASYCNARARSTMKMDILRCKSPEMVQKEIWAHLLAYNLLRTVMAVAASANEVEPRAISFKGAKQTLSAFAPNLEAARPPQRAGLVDALLKAVACHRVGNQPGRWEPRARK